MGHRPDELVVFHVSDLGPHPTTSLSESRDPHCRKTTYLGKHDTEELNNKTVTGADVWSQVTTLPFAKKLAVNYTFYITKQGNDTISHRIDFIVPGQTAGSILYGDFQPQHDLAAFRKTFMPPAPCLKKNVLPCADGFAQKIAKKYNKHEALRRGW